LGLLPLIEMISETVKEKGNLFTYYPKHNYLSVVKEDIHSLSAKRNRVLLNLDYALKIK
jgi:hypothetical protein